MEAFFFISSCGSANMTLKLRTFPCTCRVSMKLGCRTVEGLCDSIRHSVVFCVTNGRTHTHHLARFSLHPLYPSNSKTSPSEESSRDWLTVCSVMSPFLNTAMGCAAAPYAKRGGLHARASPRRRALVLPWRCVASEGKLYVRAHARFCF